MEKVGELETEQEDIEVAQISNSQVDHHQIEEVTLDDTSSDEREVSLTPQCSVCDKNFPSCQLVSAHMFSTHIAPIDNAWTDLVLGAACQICPEQFSERKLAQLHVYNEHGEVVITKLQET